MLSKTTHTTTTTAHAYLFLGCSLFLLGSLGLGSGGFLGIGRKLVGALDHDQGTRLDSLLQGGSEYVLLRRFHLVKASKTAVNDP